MDVISKEEAISLGLVRYFTGVPCPRGHISERYVSRNRCIECAKQQFSMRSDESKAKKKQYYKEYHKLNADRIRSKSKDYYYDNLDSIKKKNKAYFLDNAQRIMARNADYRTRNIDAAREYERKYYKEHKAEAKASWRKYYDTPKGRATYNARTQKRRSIRANATPAWSDLEAIRGIYLVAARVEEEKGIRVEVDHYYPLKGKSVCGLHVPENLQILTLEENRFKSNMHPDDWLRYKVKHGLSYTSTADLLSGLNEK